MYAHGLLVINTSNVLAATFCTTYDPLYQFGNRSVIATSSPFEYQCEFDVIVATPHDRDAFVMSLS